MFHWVIRATGGQSYQNTYLQQNPGHSEGAFPAFVGANDYSPLHPKNTNKQQPIPIYRQIARSM
jgi:hypothetical protein